MFDINKILASVSTPTKEASYTFSAHVITFLTALFETAMERITYERLHDLAVVDGYSSSNMSPAQQGAALVKLLPPSHQPFVCRKNGGYSSSTMEKWVNVGIDLSGTQMKALRTLALCDDVVAAFKAAGFDSTEGETPEATAIREVDVA